MPHALGTKQYHLVPEKIEPPWTSCVVKLCMQVLQKKFEEFKRDVNAGMERYTAANGLARRLVAEGHSDTVLIKEKQDTTRSGSNKEWTITQLVNPFGPHGNLLK